MKLRALIVAGIVLAALAAAPAAWAHATLEGTTPQLGQTLATEPAEVVLSFDETVEGNFGSIKVNDVNGDRVDENAVFHPNGTGSQLAVKLKPGLPNGSYSVTAVVISADSHPVFNGFVFSIGAPSAAGAGVPNIAALLDRLRPGTATQIVAATARGLDYLATAIVLGGLGFLLMVWLPALRDTAGPEDEWREASAAFLDRAQTILLGATLLGVAAGILGIVMQGAVAGSTSGWAALDAHTIREVIGTRFGLVWTIRIAAFLMLGGALVVMLRGGRAPAAHGGTPGVMERIALGSDGLAAPGLPRGALTVAAIPAAFIAEAPALGGHASESSPVFLLVPLDTIHVLAMSVWIGGLVALVALIPAATSRLRAADGTRLLASSLTYFSPLALWCVIALLVTGTIQSIIHIDSFGAIFTTPYGRAVVIKFVLLGALAALGWANRARAMPGLQSLVADGAGVGAVGGLLRKTLRAEVGLVVVVLGVTSALVNYAPPVSIPPGPFSGSAKLGPLRLKATVSPATGGPNSVSLSLADASGKPFTGVKEIHVLFSLPSKHIGPLPTDLTGAGATRQISSTQLAPKGDWQMHVIVRVSEFQEYDTTMKVPIR